MERAPVTVLKADISGSTPLGEKLDPEELRGVLGTYFAALAREIQRHGGSVDKYIGDAVMAVFGLPEAHPDDAARAVRAALAMQFAIAAENDRLEARYGVRLSLRIGVNSGELIAPDSGELTLMGDVVTIAERMEAAAPLNTVLVSGSTRAAAARRFQFVPAPPVQLKGAAGSIPAFRVTAARQRRATGVRPIAAGPASASLQVGGQKQYILQEERKVVTVLFADLSVAKGQLSADDIRPVLNAYFADVAHEIQRFGGTIDKYIGDAVMAVFGAPISHDDDGARSIAAALAIQAAIRRRNVEVERDRGVAFAARIGVNTGEVVAGLLPGEVVAYTVTGDAVNTAQRIESAAPPGDVLVSESTRALAWAAFVYESVPPLTLKGKTRPVPAFRVVRPERRASPRVGTPLVGRDEEFALLRRLREQAVGGSGQLAHLYGEPGVGKTRLIGELLTSLPRDAARLRARCASYEMETPYALVADLLRRIFGLQSADDASTARAAVTTRLGELGLAESATAPAVLLEVLGYAEASALTPEAKRRLVVFQLRALLEHRARVAGLAIVLEDVHWIDRASADALSEIAAAIPTFACLMLTTSREPNVPWAAQAIELQPLAAESAGMIIDRLGPSLDESTRALVLERTGGNPFFIEEIIHAIVDGRTTTVPTTVQDLLEARLDALDAEPRLVAQRASVIGRVFWTRILERVARPVSVEPALADLQDERFVEPRESVPERTYAFRHALAQEVVYRTQLIAQRRVAHGTVGAAIEDHFAERVDEFIDSLAFHYDRSDRDDKALIWLGRAGDRAKALFANAEAIAYYRSALRRAADGEGPLEAGTILERIGDVELVAGRYDDAITTFRAAVERIATPRPGTRARLERKVGMTLRTRGRFEDALAAFAGARALVGDDDPESAWIALSTAALQAQRADYVAAGASLARALELGERHGAEDVIAEAANQLGVIATLTGDARQAVTHYRRSIELYGRLENVRMLATVRSNLYSALRRLGRYDEALAELNASLAIRQRMGDPWAMGTSYNNLGELDRQRGRLEEALAHFAKARETWDVIGYGSGVALADLGLGAVHAALGDAAAAREKLLEAERGFGANKTYLPDLYRFRAEAELVAGDLDAAEDAATRSLDRARDANARHQVAMTERVLGEIALARGERERARELAERSLGSLAELGDEAEIGRTRALLARLT